MDHKKDNKELVAELKAARSELIELVRQDLESVGVNSKNFLGVQHRHYVTHGGSSNDDMMTYKSRESFVTSTGEVRFDNLINEGFNPLTLLCAGRLMQHLRRLNDCGEDKPLSADKTAVCLWDDTATLVAFLPDRVKDGLSESMKSKQDNPYSDISDAIEWNSNSSYWSMNNDLIKTNYEVLWPHFQQRACEAAPASTGECRLQIRVSNGKEIIPPANAFSADKFPQSAKLYDKWAVNDWDAVLGEGFSYNRLNTRDLERQLQQLKSLVNDYKEVSSLLKGDGIYEVFPGLRQWEENTANAIIVGEQRRAEAEKAAWLAKTEAERAEEALARAAADAAAFAGRFENIPIPDDLPSHPVYTLNDGKVTQGVKVVAGTVKGERVPMVKMCYGNNDGLRVRLTDEQKDKFDRGEEVTLQAVGVVPRAGKKPFLVDKPATDSSHYIGVFANSREDRYTGKPEGEGFEPFPGKELASAKGGCQMIASVPANAVVRTAYQNRKGTQSSEHFMVFDGKQLVARESLKEVNDELKRLAGAGEAPTESMNVGSVNGAEVNPPQAQTAAGGDEPVDLSNALNSLAERFADTRGRKPNKGRGKER